MAVGAFPAVIEITPMGFEKAGYDLEKIAHRMLNARPAWEIIEEILEKGEERVFDRYHGKYVRTGALKESLTQKDANDAIREAHAEELEFGTKVWYAHFQKRKKKSAVLKLLPTERKAAAKVLIEYVVFGSAGAYVE
jgi:predicted NACHT family NTPase